MSGRWAPWGQAYHDLWCPPQLYAGDPEGCDAGLAIGYVWFPLLILLAVATFLYLLARTCRDRDEEKEETPRDLHR